MKCTIERQRVSCFKWQSITVRCPGGESEAVASPLWWPKTISSYIDSEIAGTLRQQACLSCSQSATTQQVLIAITLSILALPSLSLHPPAAPWTVHDYLASRYPALLAAPPALPQPNLRGRSCTTGLLSDNEGESVSTLMDRMGMSNFSPADSRSHLQAHAPPSAFIIW